jgi:hypothetical protein
MYIRYDAGARPTCFVPPSHIKKSVLATNQSCSDASIPCLVLKKATSSQVDTTGTLSKIVQLM